ncbi:MAG: SGNH/GDSL hydrolase family protein [Acidobacteriota bacterium]
MTSGIIGLLLIEGAARWLYERPWYDHLASEQAAAETMEYQLNSFGLRGAEFVRPKPDGVRRVYMAGDSFTFGMGVADGSAVMPALVQEKLSRKEDPVEVLNGGMLRGSLPRHWRQKWHQIRDPFDPDVVLIVFFLRDGTNTGSIPAFFNAIRSEITDRNLADLLYQSSYLFRLYRDRKDRDLVANRYTHAFRQAYFGSDKEQAEWHSAQYNVLEIQKEATARGARVGFVIYPILFNLVEGEYPFQDICDLLEAFAAKHGIPTLNLLPSFYGERGPDLWVSAVDQHPNEKGHRIAAQAVAPFVQELLNDGESESLATGSP